MTEFDAELFREHVRKTVGENTARTLCTKSRQLFAAAVKHRLIDSNPFAAMRNLAALENRERARFISRADAEKVIAQLHDREMKLIVALTRSLRSLPFQGLKIALSNGDSKKSWRT